ncbi:protein VAPYRIN-LIKE-like [Typha angustifolia]|uniref:protein VAPYRIN-LIKE-like n=1 Tax=Typha angustifolia TaxID=59011 RepID=UPI003C2C9D84
MDRLVRVDVEEVEIYYRPSKRCCCSSAAFRVTNLMHTMHVAIHLSAATNPDAFSFSPSSVSVLPPLSSASFSLSLLLPSSSPPPISDSLIVRSALLPTGKADSAALLRLFSLPAVGTSVFRDASVPIALVGPHFLGAFLSLTSSNPTEDSLATESIISKAASACSPSDLSDLLLRAAADGNPRFVSALLAAGADLGSRSADGKSALSLAAASGRADVIASLLFAGAVIVSATDPGGRTVVHAAAAGGNAEALRLCLSTGGDPDRADELGWTPLHCAAAAGSLAAVEVLLSWSAYDPRLARTRDGRKTPFDVALEGGHGHLYRALQPGDELHRAARGGDAEGVRRLLQRGEAVDGGEQNGWTALHVAAMKGRVEAANALIENGARVDAVDHRGYTPLKCAMEAGNADVALSLLAHGARAGMKPSKGARLAVLEVSPSLPI